MLYNYVNEETIDNGFVNIDDGIETMSVADFRDEVEMTY